MCRHHVGTRDIGGGGQGLAPTLAGQTSEGGRCVTQGFPGKAAGWGSQRKHPTQEGAMVIKEGFLEEAWPEHEEPQEESTRQRAPHVQRFEGPTVMLCAQ